ncbi:MAG: CHAT domain-containing tetratricopeptide repeat protein [Ornithinimicrobium sp.]
MPDQRDVPDLSTLVHLRIRLDLARAWIIFEEDGPDGAVEAVTELRRMAVTERFFDLSAACDLQLGTVLGRSGNFGEALDALDRAEQGRTSMSTVDQARLFLNRGSLLSHLRQPSKAVGDFAEATILARSAGHEALAFMSAHNEGYAHFLLGDVPKALSLMEQADAMDAEVERGIAQLDRARVLLEAGLIDEAHELLLSVAASTRASGSTHDLGEIELDLARCEILRGHRPEAARLAKAARHRFRGRGEMGWRRIAHVIELEATPSNPDTARARERLGAALQHSAQADDDRVLQQRAALLRAEALIDQGKAEEARAYLDQSRRLTRSPHLATRLHTSYVAARIHDVAGRRAAAVRALRQAADDLGSARRAAAGLDLRTALTVHAAALISLDLELAMRGGSPTRILSRTELWRDVVGTQPPLRISEDPRRAEAIARLRQLREDQRQAPPGEPNERAMHEVSKAERAVRELDWATASTSGASAEKRGPMSAAGIKRAVCEAGVTLLSTLRLEGLLFAVMVAPDGRLSLHELGDLGRIRDDVRSVRADLSAAARLPQGHPFHSIVRASLLRAIGELETQLLGPVHAAGLDDTPLVIIPTPTLTTLPWGMFPSRRGRATTLARSASGWARGHTRLVHKPQVYAVAGPDVPLANGEVDSVTLAWGSGPAVSAQESTVKGLLEALERSDLVHVAAHGDHNNQNPLFSSLRLCDGPAFAHEIEGHRLRASHVVLSACDGGRVSVRRGDEPLGMTASLLALGVASVVAAVSPVPDVVAHEVMTRYHANLAAGLDASSSLAGAIAESDDVLAGAFTAYGSGWRHAADRAGRSGTPGEEVAFSTQE